MSVNKRLDMTVTLLLLYLNHIHADTGITQGPIVDVGEGMLNLGGSRYVSTCKLVSVLVQQ
ncbi:hypothetical protein [Chengkuizengella axinellae]|uniref:Uncharacterized protein n=1 Tax=Chengkuizengella axinellae TaxID=3064388 RepID=A0ABT9J3Y8_9BACL|nr:hypothetical protein [Chengkuizengella sp. 2205SS18-9]MDP5276346.1 hypothetical protein [Chengkuizengella sp. 2205SS18-9]